MTICTCALFSFQQEKKKAPLSTEAREDAAVPSAETVFGFQAMATEVSAAAANTTEVAATEEKEKPSGEQRAPRAGRGGAAGTPGGRGAGRDREPREPREPKDGAAGAGGKWAKDSSGLNSASRPPRDAEGGRGGAGRGRTVERTHDGPKGPPAHADEQGARPTSQQAARKQGGGGRGGEDAGAGGRGGRGAGRAPRDAATDGAEGAGKTGGRASNAGRGEGSSKLFAVAAKQANLSNTKPGGKVTCHCYFVICLRIWLVLSLRAKLLM